MRTYQAKTHLPRHGSYERWLLTAVAMMEAAKQSEAERQAREEAGRMLYATVYCPGFEPRAPVAEPTVPEQIGDESVTAGYTIQF